MPSKCARDSLPTCNARRVALYRNYNSSLFAVDNAFLSANVLAAFVQSFRLARAFWTAFYASPLEGEARTPIELRVARSASVRSVYNTLWSASQPRVSAALATSPACVLFNVDRRAPDAFGWSLADCAQQHAYVCETFACLPGKRRRARKLYAHRPLAAQHRCADGSGCIAPTSLCDQLTDCADGEDERDCACDCARFQTRLNATWGVVRVSAASARSCATLSACVWEIVQPPGTRTTLNVCARACGCACVDVRVCERRDRLYSFFRSTAALCVSTSTTLASRCSCARSVRAACEQRRVAYAYATSPRSTAAAAVRTLLPRSACNTRAKVRAHCATCRRHRALSTRRLNLMHATLRVVERQLFVAAAARAPRDARRLPLDARERRARRTLRADDALCARRRRRAAHLRGRKRHVYATRRLLADGTAADELCVVSARSCALSRRSARIHDGALCNAVRAE